MHSPERVKIRAFIRCIKEDGLNRLAEYLAAGAESGLVYHRSGIVGDYDLAAEDDVLRLLRGGCV
jgi:hypothetical protein